MNPAELFPEYSASGRAIFSFAREKAYHFGMNGATLRQLKKSDERKLAIARVIRRGTAVGNGWIAWEPELGHASPVSRCLKKKTANSRRNFLPLLGG